MSKFYEKLVKVQQELKAPKSNYNKFGNFKYRSAEDILEAVKPLNAKYGLLLTLKDEPVLIGDRYYIKATARIENGDTYHEVTAYAREAQTKKGMDDSQITGTASSYARKYALNGLYLIDDTKDADTDEYTEQTQMSAEEQRKQQELSNQLVTLFAKASTKVGGNETLYKKLKLTKKKVTEITKSTDTESKEKVIKQLEVILNDGNSE